jgi:DNA-directed RNA polymerase specialized sigma24 family protein
MLNVSKNRDDAIHSCFGPNAWPYEVIFPELISRAAIREIDPQQWVSDVVRRIPTWARVVLKSADNDSLEDTCQEFCLAMIKHRPDLAYDPEKGSKRAFLARILVYTHWRTLRDMRSVTTTDELDLDRAEASPNNPASEAEERELIELGRGWIAQLPKCERLAVRESLASARCMCPTKEVHYVRLCRGLRRVRVMAQIQSPDNAIPVSRRLRFPRTRRVRLPNSRTVRCVPQRLTAYFC